MALSKGKHIVEEINGIRCTVVEKGASVERVDFLKQLLIINKFEVQVAEETKVEENAPVTNIIGVTDLVFNPIIAVYQQKILTAEGQAVCPAYWNQETSVNDSRYWEFTK
ncbi:MAG TPA: hypothetical protein VF298_03980 [Bacteroidales bacterium]